MAFGMRPASPEAYQLLHEGAIALAQVETAGIRVDLFYVQQKIKEVTQQIQEKEEQLKTEDAYHVWLREYGFKTNLSSRVQLGHVLFDLLGYPCYDYTETGRPSTDEAALEPIESEFVQNYLQLEKLKKAKSTYLDGIIRETTPDGYLHALYNLHTTVTNRSSSQLVNMQNNPMRNPLLAETIRTGFIPRPGNVFIEVDQSQIEVRIAACYNQDPTMIQYIKDKYDYHKEMAAEIYIISKEDVSKMARYCGKNMFVFPQFYGSYFAQCAPHLWAAMERYSLALPNGDSLKAHLKSKGIKELGDCNPKLRPRPGTFERHIKTVEDRFWSERFHVYANWKKNWYEKYLRRGYFRTKMGFLSQGIYSRNDVVNHPIQCDAFQCGLLWPMIRMIRRLKKYKMKSKVVAEIHDSMLLDVPRKEVSAVVEMAQNIMVKELMKAHRWIIVPIEIEAEIAEDNWWNKKALEAA